MRAGQRVEEETRVGKQLTEVLRKPPRQLTFLNVYRSPGFPSRCLFPSLCGESSGHRPTGPCILLIHALSELSPWPHRQSKPFFLMNSAPVPEEALLPLLQPPLSAASVNSFKTTSTFFSPNSLHQMHLNPRAAVMFVFPTQPSGCWLKLQAPGPGPFLASMGSMKPLLSEKLLTWRFIVYQCISRSRESNVEGISLQ